MNTRELKPAILDKKNKKYKAVQKISDIEKAQKRATEIYKSLGTLYLSTNKNKKFMMYDPIQKKMIHFGSFKPPMEDYLKHGDEKRRESFIRRMMGTKGKAKSNPFSPLNLSLFILW